LKLADKIGRMRKISIQRGRIEIWAAAIVYIIARLNFLFDPESEGHITADKPKQRTKARTEKPARNPEKKDGDDRQLNLFDDK
jgi:hypothetical protein